jgi:hypothetical protein
MCVFVNQEIQVGTTLKRGLLKDRLDFFFLQNNFASVNVDSLINTCYTQRLCQLNFINS